MIAQSIKTLIFLALLSIQASAQYQYLESDLYSFTATNTGGFSSLISDTSGNLYGMSGTIAAGIVFELSPPTAPGNPWTQQVLYSFSGGVDGSDPTGALLMDKAGNLYGTTTLAGATGNGTVFELSPPATPGNPWTKQTLYSFGGGADASSPSGVALVMDASGNLYGTTSGGGSAGKGTVFELSPPSAPGNPWTERVLHGFTGGSDGSFPYAGVIMDTAGNLYGTTSGGNSFLGTVFELSPPTVPGNPWTEQVIHNFTGGRTDGGYPQDGLIMDASGNLYGTTLFGGAYLYGLVFELSPPTVAGNPWTQQILHSFNYTEGYSPYASLIFDAAGNLYGTTGRGPVVEDSGSGVVFELSPPTTPGNPWTEGVLYIFPGTGNTDSASSLLLDASGNLYGTASYVGSTGNGAVFELIRLNPQTITVTSTPPTGTAAYAGDTYTPTDTGGGSTNPVTVSIDTSTATGVCTASNGIVTATAPGTCVIDFNEAGGSGYSAAPQVQQSWLIGGQPQTIAVTSTPPAGASVNSPAYLPIDSSSSGLSVSVTIDAASTPGACLASGGVVTPTGLGTCVIDFNQAGNSNYFAAAQVQQTWTICSNNIVVTTSADPNANFPTTTALRDAMTYVCAGGTITFGPNIAGSTITLSSTLPTISQSMTIDGTGENITVDGAKINQIINVSSGNVVIKALTLQNGLAASYGGAIQNSATLTLSNITFANNASNYMGGAVYNTGTISISSSTFSANSTSGFGGAFASSAGSSTLINDNFLNNRAGPYGGAIDIQYAQTMNVQSSAFANNSASYGGAIAIQDGGTNTLVNNTFSANSATEIGGAMAVFGSASGQRLTLTNNTVSGNSAGSGLGGGVVNATGTVSTVVLQNTILSNNGVGTNCGTDFLPSTDGTGNISDDASCGFTAPNSLNNQPLSLSALALNTPGTTDTMALVPIVNQQLNTAIGFAKNNCPATDQRGDTRYIACDAGAYEVVPRPCASGSWSASGTVPTGGQTCTPATAGFYVGTAGATSETACKAGSYCAGSGDTAPTQTCPAGSYCPAGASAPTACPAGDYCAGTGDSSPTPAPVGSYDPGTGNVSAIACPTGTTTLVAGSTFCLADTTMSYTGPTKVATNSSFVPTATLASSAMPACASGERVAFSLSANPTNGQSGSYSLGSGTTASNGTVSAPSVSTTNWQYGTYQLTASFAGNSTCVASSGNASLTVPRPPVANAGGPYTGNLSTAAVPAPITLSGTGSTDPNGYALSYLWSVNSSSCTIANQTTAKPTVTCTTVGTYTLSLTVNDGYGSNSSSVQLKINSVTPTITWAIPAPIIYGTALSSKQLNAVASYGGVTVTGTYTYTPASGTVLAAGANQDLHVVFKPTSSNYNSASADVYITVNYGISNISPSNNTAFKEGSSIQVKFNLTSSNGASISTSLAQSISSKCQATVVLSGQTSVCATYSSGYFQAKLTAPKTAGTSTITIGYPATSTAITISSTK